MVVDPALVAIATASAVLSAIATMLVLRRRARREMARAVNRLRLEGEATRGTLAHKLAGSIEGQRLLELDYRQVLAALMDRLNRLTGELGEAQGALAATEADHARTLDAWREDARRFAGSSIELAFIRSELAVYRRGRPR